MPILMSVSCSTMRSAQLHSTSMPQPEPPHCERIQQRLRMRPTPTLAFALAPASAAENRWGGAVTRHAVADAKLSMLFHIPAGHTLDAGVESLRRRQLQRTAAARRRRRLLEQVDHDACG